MTSPEITAITMPKWGLTMTEGTVVGWLKQQGQSIAEGEQLLEIETGLPQELPRQAVELRAGGAVGEYRARDRHVSAQHAGETVTHFRRGFADRQGAGDVGGAVFILRAGIDQQQIAG